MRQRWLAAILDRIHELASQGRVHFTLKALRELAVLDIGLDEEDAHHVLANLTAGDVVERVVSNKTGEWMYVFKPRIGRTVVYVKVIVRSNCVVISFHEEEDQIDEDN